MKTIDLSAPIMSEDGVQSTQIVYNTDDEGKKEKKVIKATLYRIVRESLLANNGDQCAKTIERRYDLFQSIYNKDTIDLSKKDRDFIIKLLVAKFGVYFAGQAIKLLK